MTTNTPEGNAFRADNDGSSDALMRVYPLDRFLYKCYVFHSSDMLYLLLLLGCSVREEDDILQEPLLLHVKSHGIRSRCLSPCPICMDKSTTSVFPLHQCQGNLNLYVTAMSGFRLSVLSYSSRISAMC